MHVPSPIIGALDIIGSLPTSTCHSTIIFYFSYSIEKNTICPSSWLVESEDSVVYLVRYENVGRLLNIIR